jgi:hypothetical protein
MENSLKRSIGAVLNDVVSDIYMIKKQLKEKKKLRQSLINELLILNTAIVPVENIVVDLPLPPLLLPGAEPGLEPAEAEPGPVPAGAEPGLLPAEAEPGPVPAGAEPGPVPAGAEPGLLPAEAEPGPEPVEMSPPRTPPPPQLKAAQSPTSTIITRRNAAKKESPLCSCGGCIREKGKLKKRGFCYSVYCLRKDGTPRKRTIPLYYYNCATKGCKQTICQGCFKNL